MGGRATKRGPRRPLENGTLLPDFLGRQNLVSRSRRLEKRTEDMETSMLSLGAADSAYARRRGSLLFTGWGQPNVANGQTNVTLARFGVSYMAPLILPFGGSVTAVLVGLSTARTAGTLTVKVYVDGVDSGFSAVIDGDNPLYVEESLLVGECVFEAGQPVTLRITTSGWSPSSADLLVMIEVAGA